MLDTAKYQFCEVIGLTRSGIELPIFRTGSPRCIDSVTASYRDVNFKPSRNGGQWHCSNTSSLHRLSGKDPRSQVGLDSAIAQRSLGGVMIRTQVVYVHITIVSV